MNWELIKARQGLLTEWNTAGTFCKQHPMKIGNLGNQGNQNINGNISNHCNLGSHVNGGHTNKKSSHQCTWYVHVHTKCHYFCLVLTTLEFGLEILVKIPNTKFHELLASMSTMTPCG
jgi:hypothetical protein